MSGTRRWRSARPAARAPGRPPTAWERFRRRRWWVQALAWIVLPPVPVAVWATSQRRGRAAAWALVVLVTAAWVTLASRSDTADTSAATAGDPSSAPSTTPPETAEPSATAPAAEPPAGSQPAAEPAPTASAAGPEPAPGDASIVDRLTLAPEGSGAGYDRELFDHWIDADADGCDTRCEVLEEERRTDLPGLPGGGWLSRYDGYATPDPGELDIDHVVALAEAWRSGAAAWDPARREAFANDLDDARALVAVTAATNRSKGDKDPAEWQPPNREAWCWYADAWVATKVRWELTADEAEVGALRNMLAGC